MNRREGDGAGSGERRILAAVEYCCGWRTIQKVAELNEVNRKNIFEPLKVNCAEGVSFTLAFHSLTKDATNYPNIEVQIEDVVSGSLSLDIEVELIRVARSMNAVANITNDRTSWPAPEAPIKKLVHGDGEVCKLQFGSTRHLSVKLEVFAEGGTGSPITAGLDALRRSDELADVVLAVGGAKFSAHRAVLAASSPVFLRMFAGDFKEGRKKDGKDAAAAEPVLVDVKDVSKEAFTVFLSLMYTGSAADWKGLEVELLELADRYMADHIKAECERRLMGMDALTALGLLRHADKPVISRDIRVRAVQAVLRGWERIVILPQWRDFQEASPVLADTLRAAQELLPKA